MHLPRQPLKRPSGFTAQAPTYTAARQLHQFYSSYFSCVMLVQQFNSQSCSILFLEKGGSVSIAGFGTGNLSSTANECPTQFKWEIYCCHFKQALAESGVLASSIIDMV